MNRKTAAIIAGIIITIATMTSALADTSMWTRPPTWASMNYTGNFDQDLNTTSNVRFNSTRIGDADEQIQTDYWDLSFINPSFGKLPYLRGWSSGGVNGYIGLYKTPIVLSDGSDPCFGAIDMQNIGMGIQNFCWEEGNSRWAFSGDLDVAGDFSLGGALTAGLIVPQNVNITFVGQNGYNSIMKNEWNGGNYDLHTYDNTGNYYYGFANGDFVIPKTLRSQQSIYNAITLDDGNGQALWQIYGGGGNRTALDISYGGSGLDDNATMLKISNMATPGKLFELTGEGGLWVRKNLTTNTTIKAEEGIIINNLSVGGELSGSRQYIFGGKQDGTTASAYLIANVGGTYTMNATKGFVAIRSGSITGLSIDADVSVNTTLGNVSIQTLVNGTQVYNITFPITDLGTYKPYATIPRHTLNFSAGDVLTQYLNFDSFSGTIATILVTEEITTDT